MSFSEMQSRTAKGRRKQILRALWLKQIRGLLFFSHEGSLNVSRPMLLWELQDTSRKPGCFSFATTLTV